MQNAVNCRTGREVLGANTEIESSSAAGPHYHCKKRGPIYNCDLPQDPSTDLVWTSLGPLSRKELFAALGLVRLRGPTESELESDHAAIRRRIREIPAIRWNLWLVLQRFRLWVDHAADSLL